MAKYLLKARWLRASWRTEGPFASSPGSGAPSHSAALAPISCGAITRHGTLGNVARSALWEAPAQRLRQTAAKQVGVVRYRRWYLRAGVDPLGKTLAVVEKLGLTFPIAHGVTREDSDALAA